MLPYGVQGINLWLVSECCLLVLPLLMLCTLQKNKWWADRKKEAEKNVTLKEFKVCGGGAVGVGYTSAGREGWEAATWNGGRTAGGSQSAEKGAYRMCVGEPPGCVGGRGGLAQQEAVEGGQDRGIPR